MGLMETYAQEMGAPAWTLKGGWSATFVHWLMAKYHNAIKYDDSEVIDRVCTYYQTDYPRMSYTAQDELRYMAKTWGKAWSEELQTH